MGTSKTEKFSRTQNDLASVAKALGHPARIAILQALMRAPSSACGDIVAALPLSQSTVSQHLKELSRSGLITGEIEGPRVAYSIDQKGWRKARKVVGDLFDGYAEAAGG